MESARVAIEALEHVGVDGDEIELLGQPADVARFPSQPQGPDRRMALHLVRRIALGALAGVLAGLVLGLLAGGLMVAAFNDTTDSSAGLVTAIAIVGVGLGVTLGVLVSFERAIGLSDAWPLTFEDVPDGPVWVAVYTGGGRTRARAADALARHQPLELRRGAA